MSRPFGRAELGRAREIITVLIRHGFGEALGKLPATLLQRGDTAADESAKSLSGPQRALRVIEELGPTFVKLGQILSTRPDILPQDYIDAFSTLQDSVPPFEGKQAREIVARELREPVDDIFVGFETEAVASASIAQVHRAELPDGRQVAVKIQRPDIEDRIRSDIHILQRLADLAEDQLEQIGLYSPSTILQQFERAVTSELDFLTEARNAEVLRRNLATLEGVAVPEVVRRFSTHRVLTLTWFEGRKLATYAERELDAQAFMDQVVAATYQQVFVDGFFHADPHPGNLLIADDGTLGYVDFGLMGQLTRKQQDLLVDLFVAIVFKDAESVARACYRAGGSEGRLDLRAFANEADGLFSRYSGLAMGDQPMATILVDLVQLASRHRLRLPEEYAMLARAGVTLDGVARMHVPDWNMFETLKPFALKLATGRHDLGRLSTDALTMANQAMAAARDLPLQMDQIMMDLEKGRVRVTTHNDDLRELNHTVRRMGIALLLAMGAAALLVSAAVLTAGTDADVFGFPFMKAVSAIAIVVSLSTASSLLGALGFHLAVTGRLRPRVLARVLVWFFKREK